MRTAGADPARGVARLRVLAMIAGLAGLLDLGGPRAGPTMSAVVAAGAVPALAAGGTGERTAVDATAAGFAVPAGQRTAVSTTGRWRLEIGTVGGEPPAAAWAAGRDAAGNWYRLPGRREGSLWVFTVPADPPLTEVRFGGEGGDAGPIGQPDEPAAGRPAGEAGGDTTASNPGALTWRVVWEDGDAAGPPADGVPVGRGLPPPPNWVPGADPLGDEPGAALGGLLQPPDAVERPRWSPPAPDGAGRGGRAGGNASRSRREPPPLPSATHGVVQLPPGIPAIEVTLPTRRTTHWQSLERGHVLWRWDFGDGTQWVDPNPNHAIVQQPHRFPGAGSYAVEAISYDGTGRPLIRYRWHVTVPPADAAARAVGAAIPGLADDAVLAAARELARWRLFPAAAPEAPRVQLALEGPRRWVVGRPATYRLRAEIQNPPFTERVEVDYDPGPVFSVRWRRPGTFAVDGAVRVRVHYRIHGRALALSHVYRVTETVQVHALHLEE
ncbi:hypothetical protein E1B22_09995 [Thermaerobacter sp. FW80]|nr:hypothetical protein E1B22_09995 [Thermaerobacter sp. FW80]